MAQNFDGEITDEFDEFLAIQQYFPYQNFHLLATINNLSASFPQRGNISHTAPHHTGSSLSFVIVTLN